ncbi:hypothetical protein ACFPA8_15990 [Streptomyces ovatisporus]|uniref:DUF1963 domain-containing protein n=1 Tax=Streptomyces ovatisporus TaxID=1128682 RepID=A0ABV9A9N4_9ACTN
MSRTTPPRPLDPEELFPELGDFRLGTVRLHPRPGKPGPQESSVGGPMLWPTDEPWPVCTRPGGDDHPAEPVPMLPVAQLYERDIPGLPAPDGKDLLQVFWCGFTGHTDGHELNVHVAWRRSSSVAEPLGSPPVPEVEGTDNLVPSPCVLDPEEVLEHEDLWALPEELRERIETWEEETEEAAEDVWEEDADEPPTYTHDLSIAPGWKSGGGVSWTLTAAPVPVTCETCGAAMHPLLTADTREWDGGTTSWIPLEDQPTADTYGSNVPTGIYVGRGRLIVFACPTDPEHPHQWVSQ